VAIGGGIKFFNKSQSLAADGSSMVASSGVGSEDYALDRNPITKWRSVGSDDTTTETLTLTLPTATTIDRILILDHNWKEFTIKYDSATDFTTVVGLDGALGGGITETAYVDTSLYYEFASVSATTIEITVTKTHVVDAQKYASQIIVTTELGTLQGYPEIADVEHKRASRNSVMLSGRMLIQKSIESHDMQLNFKNYPARSPYDADIDLMFSLFDRDDSFIVWPCGGRRGSTYFSYGLRGFRLQDAYTMQVEKPYKVKFSKNVYQNSVNMAVALAEVV